MAAFKPAYLIHGDDHGRIGERRGRLRALAEAQSGASGAEVLEGDAASPDAVATELSAMTFALGRRFILVDGVERWRDKQLDGLLRALAAIPPETTIAFFAQEDGRAKAPPRLAEAVKAAGGDVSAEQSVKPWELPKWVVARARELGLQLDPDAARALVRQVGERQQRLLRELEKLALDAPAGASIDSGQVQELTAPSAQHKAWSLADELVGADAAAATRSYLALRAQGERVAGLIYWMAARLRMAHEIAEAAQDGESVAQLKRRLRMPGRAADRLIADAARTGPDELRRAIEEIADLELASRGGGAGGAGEDTAALIAIRRIAGGAEALGLARL
ncbi:MAG: DNA polymerase III subunit delta [Solirubrobacteraceae bacterium]